MYKQENKAGLKELFLVLIMAFLAVLVSEALGLLIDSVIPQNIPWIGDLILVAMCVFMIFLVYHHYASVYNYKITKKHIVIEKKTGRKVTEYDIPILEINKIYIRKRVPKLQGKKLRLCSSIIGYKKTVTMVCGQDDTVVTFQPDDNFVKKIKEYMDD